MLIEMLSQVSDSYPDFCTGIGCVCKNNAELTQMVIDFISSNPNAKTDSIIEYVLGIIPPQNIEIVDDDELDDD